MPLRPLGLGELLDGALTTIRTHPRLVLGTAAVVAVVGQVLGLIATLGAGDELGALLADTQNGSVPSPEEVGALVGSVGGVGAVGLLVQVASTTVLTGLLMVVLGRAVLGAPVEAADCWRAARTRLPGLLAVVVLGLLAVLLLLVVCALPALVVGFAGGGVAPTVVLGLLGLIVAVLGTVAVSTLIALAPPVYVLEGVGVAAAFRRSVRLVGGRFWPVLGILVLAGLITAVVAGIIGIPFSAGGGLLAGGGADANPYTFLPLLLQAVGSVVALTLTAPFQAAVTGLLYVDVRMRREGFDIELQRAAAR